MVHLTELPAPAEQSIFIDSERSLPKGDLRGRHLGLRRRSQGQARQSRHFGRAGGSASGALERLLHELAALGGLAPSGLSLVGETTLSQMQTRPDYAVIVNNALVGFIEVKAPGKGCDPRKFADPHDKAQWGKLKSLPNLLYTDGNGFSLWRNGEPEGKIVLLEGDIESAGAKLKAPETLRALIADFLTWAPQPPTSARALARDQRPPLPPVTGRGAGGDGGRPRQPAGFEARLAQAALPRGQRRAIRRRLCAGGDLRPPDGEGLRHFAERWRRTGGDQAAKNEHADRHGAQPSDPGRSQSAIAENLARHADSRPQRSELVDSQQGQAGGLALFL